MCFFPGSRAELSTTCGLGADSKRLGRGRGVCLWLCRRVIGDICGVDAATDSALDTGTLKYFIEIILLLKVINIAFAMDSHAEKLCGFTHVPTFPKRHKVSFLCFYKP